MPPFLPSLSNKNCWFILLSAPDLAAASLWEMHGDACSAPAITSAARDAPGCQACTPDQKAQPGGKDIHTLTDPHTLHTHPDLATLTLKSSQVVDNSSAFRMTEGVPLCIPEVNAAAVDPITLGEGGIVANPNCSTIIALMAVTPLHRKASVQRMVVSTYQVCKARSLPGPIHGGSNTDSWIAQQKLHIYTCLRAAQCGIHLTAVQGSKREGALCALGLKGWNRSC